MWEALRDISTHTRWMADAEWIRFTSARREGTGTTFDCYTRVGPLKLTDRMEITSWEPARQMGVRHVGVVTGTGRFTLRRSTRGGTRFRWVESLHFPWWMGGPVGALAGSLVLGFVWHRNLRRLKHLIESGALP